MSQEKIIKKEKTIKEKLELIKKYADNLARERARFLFGSQYKGEAHCDEIGRASCRERV